MGKNKGFKFWCAGKKSGGLRPVGVGKLCDSAQGRESQVQRIFREELFQGLGIGQAIGRDDLVVNNLGWDNAKKFKFSKQESKCC